MSRSMLQLVILFAALFGICTLVLVVVFRHVEKNDTGLNPGPFRLKPNYYQARRSTGGARDSISHDGIIDYEQIKKILSDALEDIDRDRIDDAEDKVKTVLVFDPDNLQALTIVGRIYYSSKRYAEAEYIFRRQIRLSAGNPTVLNNLGSTLVRLNKYTEAVSYLRQAWVKAPDSPEIIINLAGAYALNGDRNAALQMLRSGEKILGPALLPLAEDSCFDSIRNLAEFRRLMRRIADNVNSNTISSGVPGQSASRQGSDK